MHLYADSLKQFIDDTEKNEVSQKLYESFKEHYRCEPSSNEVRAWENSLEALKDDVLVKSDLTKTGVILEYQLPLTSKRLDCMLTGYNSSREPQAVIIELKQWSKCKSAPGENEVTTFVGGGEKEVLHPSAQVAQYSRYIKDNLTAFYEEKNPINLDSCSYLHNYTFSNGDELTHHKFKDLLRKYPVFTEENKSRFSEYLTDKLSYGDGLEVLKRIDESNYRPSKKLMNQVGNIIKGKEEYVLIDQQKVVYDKITSLVREGVGTDKTNVIIIKGGPGTGKSVIALNLMADLLLKEYNAHYATGSRAFTKTLRKEIGKSGAVQFKYFNNYTEADSNEVDVIICDEAHRIREFSDDKSEEENIRQVEELINAAKVCVFFIDDDQVVRPDEKGSVAHIKNYAEDLGCKIHEHELEVQFRCSGSEAFINWINDTLNIKNTANKVWKSDEDFDFKIFPDPFSLEEAIREKEKEGYSARLTAGFCWPWSSETNDDGSLKKDVVIDEFKRPWNAPPWVSGLKEDIPESDYWATDPNGIDQIGCIYTAQGFEFDYVGVIFGKDLVYDFDKKKWVGNKSESEDYKVKKSKDNFLDLVKNTYRVLLTRGHKGCYVYFMDKDTEEYFKLNME